MEMSTLVTTGTGGVGGRGGGGGGGGGGGAGGRKLPRLPPISPDTPKLKHARMIMHKGDLIATQSGVGNISPKIKKQPSLLSRGSSFSASQRKKGGGEE